MMNMNSSNYVLLESLVFAEEQKICFGVSGGVVVFLFFLIMVFKRKLKPLLEYNITEKHNATGSELPTLSKQCQRVNNMSGARDACVSFRSDDEEEPTNRCAVNCVHVFAATVLIMVDVVDFCEDVFVVVYYINIEETICALLYMTFILVSIVASYLVVLYHLYSRQGSSKKRTRLALLLFVFCPFLKTCILCWTLLVGKKSWRKRWYLQVLSFLWLVEAALEGTPQMILQWYLKNEDETFYINLFHTDWSLIINFISTSLSLSYATKDFDQQEEHETSKSRTLVTNSCRNRCISFLQKMLYIVSLYLTRSLEIFIRVATFGTFASTIGWKLLMYIVGGCFIVFFIISVICYRTLEHKNLIYDSHIQKPTLKSSLILGLLVNITFCHSWAFCQIWSRKVVYIVYYVYFYMTTIPLAITSHIISGYVDHFSIAAYSVIIIQLMCFILCIVSRECKRKKLLQM